MHSNYGKSHQTKQREVGGLEGNVWDQWDIVELCSENLIFEGLGIRADVAEFEIEQAHCLLARCRTQTDR